MGGLQWPATQTSPHLSATVSLLCGEVTKATVGTLRAANKALRFAKENGDVGLKCLDMGKPNDLAMVAMSDAAWGVRADGQSQGGYLVVLTHRKALQGAECPYVVLDWRSYRLPRVSRSSLNAEAQACAGAMDAMEYLMTFWQGCFNAAFTLRDPGLEGRIEESAPVWHTQSFWQAWFLRLKAQEKNQHKMSGSTWHWSLCWSSHFQGFQFGQFSEMFLRQFGSSLFVQSWLQL